MCGAWHHLLPFAEEVSDEEMSEDDEQENENHIVVGEWLPATVPMSSLLWVQLPGPTCGPPQLCHSPMCRSPKLCSQEQKWSSDTLPLAAWQSVPTGT